MKKFILVSLLACSFASTVFADESASIKTKVKRSPSAASVNLSDSTSKIIGNLLRDASNKGNKSVVFGGGPQVTTYSVGSDLICYFQNSDDSVSCSAGQ